MSEEKTENKDSENIFIKLLHNEKILQLIKYGFWGLLTTLVNIAIFWVLRHFEVFALTVSAWIAWFISVLFAYVTNRKWVFNSTAKGPKEISIECLKFYLARLFSGIIDVALLALLVKICGLNEMVSKIISNIVVIILNYLLSLFAVFRKKQA